MGCLSDKWGRRQAACHGRGELGVFREFSWVPCPSSGKEEAGQGIRKPGLKVMP